MYILRTIVEELFVKDLYLWKLILILLFTILEIIKSFLQDNEKKKRCEGNYG